MNNNVRKEKLKYKVANCYTNNYNNNNDLESSRQQRPKKKTFWFDMYQSSERSREKERECWRKSAQQHDLIQYARRRDRIWLQTAKAQSNKIVSSLNAAYRRLRDHTQYVWTRTEPWTHRREFNYTNTKYELSIWYCDVWAISNKRL